MEVKDFIVYNLSIYNYAKIKIVTGILYKEYITNCSITCFKLKLSNFVAEGYIMMMMFELNLSLNEFLMICKMFRIKEIVSLQFIHKFPGISIF